MNGAVILARGVVARGAGTLDVCTECGQNVVIGERCVDCRQTAAPDGWAGTLVVAIAIDGHRQVVTAERTPDGGWSPVALGQTAGGVVTPGVTTGQ